MRAVQITSLDGPEKIEVLQIAEPKPLEGEVTIQVHAAGVAFPELLQTRGGYHVRPDPPFTPGTEVAGVVLSAPADATVKVGDRVAALPGLNGLAEVVTCPANMVFPLPDEMSFTQGAAVPMNYMTAHFALRRRGHLEAGETVLVHGAGGGVGTAACQLASAWGARVIAVVSTAEKGEVAKAAGAHDIVLADDFLTQVKDLTGGQGVDIVVDPVGGDRFTDSLRSLATEGRLLAIGFTSGEIPTVKVNRLLFNNISVVGVAWSYAQARPDFLAWQWEELRPLMSDGRISPPIGGEWPIDDAKEAFLALDQRRATGKMIVRLV